MCERYYYSRSGFHDSTGRRSGAQLMSSGKVGVLMSDEVFVEWLICGVCMVFGYFVLCTLCGP